MRQLVLAACLLGSGCASWRKSTETTLAYVHQAAVTARQVAEPALGKQCLAAAQACQISNVAEADCRAYHDCDQRRITVANALKVIHYTILDAKIALALQDAKRADGLVSELTKLLATVQQQVAALRGL